MDVKKAVISFLIAALAPGVVAIVTTPAGASSISTGIVVFGIWYLFSLPVIFAVGFATLFIALKLKYGPVFLPPLVGGLSGLLIAKITYTQGTEIQDMWLLVLDGFLTAVVAALVYFRPWSNRQGRP